jgi:hypothetical protein
MASKIVVFPSRSFRTAGDVAETGEVDGVGAGEGAEVFKG